MTRDAIVDEVRAIRDEIAKEYDYDVHALFAQLRRAEATGSTAHVSFVSHARLPATAHKGSAADGASRDR